MKMNQTKKLMMRIIYIVKYVKKSLKVKISQLIIINQNNILNEKSRFSSQLPVNKKYQSQNDQRKCKYYSIRRKKTNNHNKKLKKRRRKLLRNKLNTNLKNRQIRQWIKSMKMMISHTLKIRNKIVRKLIIKNRKKTKPNILFVYLAIFHLYQNHNIRNI